MRKQELIVYEGAMCCSTGVCGPEPDRTLIEFNETLKRLTGEYGDKLKIMRASLTFDSFVLMAHPEIAKLVKEGGTGVLPITTLDGEIIAGQRYLTYSEMKEHLDDKVAKK